MEKTSQIKGRRNKTTPVLLRVICVHDSSRLHAQLGEVLTEENGFRIVLHAKNTNEAQAYLGIFTADLMTLDVQLASEDAVSYLQRAYNGRHPAVVMLASQSTSENDLIKRSLEFGSTDVLRVAKDQSLFDYADDFRVRLRHAHLAKQKAHLPQAGIDEKVFSQFGLVKMPTRGVHVVAASFSDLVGSQDLFRDLTHSSFPLVVLFPGSRPDDLQVKKCAAELNKVLGKPAQLLSMIAPRQVKSEEVLFGFDEDVGAHLSSVFPGCSLAVQVLCAQGFACLVALKKHPEASFFLDEKKLNPNFVGEGAQVIPISSISYLAVEYLRRTFLRDAA